MNLLIITIASVAIITGIVYLLIKLIKSLKH